MPWSKSVVRKTEEGETGRYKFKRQTSGKDTMERRSDELPLHTHGAAVKFFFPTGLPHGESIGQNERSSQLRLRTTAKSPHYPP